MKNLVVCCDGTGNETGFFATNVLRIQRLAKGIDRDQIVYYDFGVGTKDKPRLRAAFCDLGEYPSWSPCGLGCVKTCTREKDAEVFSLSSSPDCGRQRCSTPPASRPAGPS
jgi:hypothetical protein